MVWAYASTTSCRPGELLNFRLRDIAGSAVHVQIEDVVSSQPVYSEPVRADSGTGKTGPAAYTARFSAPRKTSATRCISRSENEQKLGPVSCCRFLLPHGKPTTEPASRENPSTGRRVLPGPELLPSTGPVAARRQRNGNSL